MYSDDDSDDSLQEKKKKKRKRKRERNVRRNMTEKKKNTKKLKADTISEKSVICLLDNDDEEETDPIMKSQVDSKNSTKRLIKKETEINKMPVKTEVKGHKSVTTEEAIEIDGGENIDDDTGVDADAVKYLKVSQCMYISLRTYYCLSKDRNHKE